MSIQPSSNNQRFVLITASTAAAITLTTIIWFTSKYFYQKRKRTKEFVKAGIVHELFLYPIKSCKPNKVNWIDCRKRGASNDEEFDRHFLLVDSLQDNLFLTARIYPKMVLIEAHIFNGKLIVKFGSNEKCVEIDLKQVIENGQIRRARSWPSSQQRQMPFLSSSKETKNIQDQLSPLPYSLYADKQTEGFDCGDEIGKAFDDFLEVGNKRSLRLIWFGDEEILFTERDGQSKDEYWLNNPVPKLDDNIAFHDLASFMSFSLESVTDINKNLKLKNLPSVDSRNFRPTLVISGLPPFDEDYWLNIKAGDAEFICYKPCTRCILTTVNPDTGEKCPKMEPLNMLRKYRLAPGKLYEQYKESPIFGVNMAIVKPGRVRVGDPVWILYKPKPF